jgi:amidophosphoribosyltransferase
VQEVADFLEVDSLAYLSLEGLTACMRGKPTDYCSACWSGSTRCPVDNPQSKFSFERDQLKMF